jgi:hypothetical protein
VRLLHRHRWTYYGPTISGMRGAPDRPYRRCQTCPKRQQWAGRMDQEGHFDYGGEWVAAGEGQ